MSKACAKSGSRALVKAVAVRLEHTNNAVEKAEAAGSVSVASNPTGLPPRLDAASPGDIICVFNAPPQHANLSSLFTPSAKDERPARDRRLSAGEMPIHLKTSCKSQVEAAGTWPTWYPNRREMSRRPLRHRYRGRYHPGRGWPRVHLPSRRDDVFNACMKPVGHRRGRESAARTAAYTTRRQPRSSYAGTYELLGAPARACPGHPRR